MAVKPIPDGYQAVTPYLIVSPFATERSSRRMILPLRVLGRFSPKRMSLGLAMGPISLPTQSRNSLAMRLEIGRAHV